MTEYAKLRQSTSPTLTHTPDHANCPACAALEGMQLLGPEVPFADAGRIWLEDHSTYIKRGTYRVYVQYVRTLTEFFGSLPLGEFHVGNVRAYQRWRLGHAGPLRANAEVQSALKPILREANQWKRIADVYKPLPVPKKKVRQNMSEEEERRLVAVALDSTHTRRLLAGHCLIVMANTGMGFGELRHLKREDVFLSEERPFVTVNEGTKNDYRIRTITLNFLALRSMRWIVKRWEKLGGTEPEQYVLPHHARRTPEERRQKGHKRQSPPIFTEPMGHIYRAARAILKDAGLSHLDPYDMRSHCITKILSDPDASDQMVREIIGHSNTRTRDRYSKQRLEKKAVIMDRMCIESAPSTRLIAFPGGLRH